MPFVEVERSGASGVIRFTNAPEGVIGTPGSVEMLSAFRTLAADSAVNAIIFTGGQPGMFIRHYDVSEFVAIIEASEQGVAPPDFGGTPGDAIITLIREIGEARQPVLAAINGICMGGGFELALACDLRIADPAVEAIGLPETRAGTFPAGGGPARLTRMIGEAQTLNMVLRGLTFTGQEAFELGLVTELAGDPLGRALEIAAVWEGRVSDGLPYAKRIIRSALDRTLADNMVEEGRSHAEVLESPAVRENIYRVLPPGDIRDL